MNSERGIGMFHIATDRGIGPTYLKDNGLGAGVPDPSEQEVLRFTVIGVEELTRESSRELLDAYVRFLNDPLNRRHFANPPTNVRELRSMVSEPRLHPLIARNALGDVVGGMTFSDANPNEHDHMLGLVVVDPYLQQRRGVGRQMLEKGIDWAFSTLAVDRQKNLSRVRTKIDVAIIEGVEGWDRMHGLIESLGFTHLHRIPRQVDIPIFTPDGALERGEDGDLRMETRAANRWELKRSDWEEYKRSRSGTN